MKPLKEFLQERGFMLQIPSILPADLQDNQATIWQEFEGPIYIFLKRAGVSHRVVNAKSPVVERAIEQVIASFGESRPLTENSIKESA